MSGGPISINSVHFLVAGVQKGGTTALFEYLREHPELNMAPEKEVHFFDDETIDWSRPDYAAYHARFERGCRDRFNGEATPIYLYWPNCLERIAAYAPKMKLILLFRDPVARAWSHWRMESSRGAETEPFAWCIREGRRRVAQGRPPGFHRVHSYVERGFYGAQLQRLLTLFPRDQLLMLRSTDLDRDPGEVIGRISGFMGVDPPTIVRPRRVHVTRATGAKMKADDTAYLTHLFAEDADLFRSLAGPDLARESRDDE